MSFIDTYRHAACGFLAGVPLYHPEEDIPGGDFTATRHDLVLGGGGGEHPGAVIDVPAAAVQAIEEHLETVYCAICDGNGRALNAPIACDTCEGSGLDNDWGGSAVKQLGIDAGLHADQVLPAFREITDTLIAGNTTRLVNVVNADWSGDTWADFVASAALPTPYGRGYDREVHHSIEHWIAFCVGEYVLVCAGNLLVTNPQVKLTAQQRTLLAALGAFVGRSPMFAGVVQYPTGYEMLGRGETLSEPNMRH